MKPVRLKIVSRCFSLAFAAGWLVIPLPALSQGYDDTFEMRNKVKAEFQYSDYGQYEYPEPILFEYGLSDYTQNHPYIVNFPEKRFLCKFTRLAGSKTALSAKVQFSELRQDVKQNLLELKTTRNLGVSLTGLFGFQWTSDTRDFDTYQPGLGFQWLVGPLSTLQGDVQYYIRGAEATAVGGRMEALNVRMKFRQVITVSTAVLAEYIFYDAKGDEISFTSHSGALWLSQFLPTQTAVHLCVRYYDNSMGIRSWAPSLEIAQYLNWATVLRVKYRYYANQSENVSLGERDVIIPDNLVSHTVSAQLNREMTPDVEVYVKYRYYRSNLGIQMNAYLVGFVWAF